MSLATRFPICFYGVVLLPSSIPAQYGFLRHTITSQNQQFQTLALGSKIASRQVGGQVVLLNVLGCRLTYQGQVVTNAEARFNIALRPRKPEGSLGRTAQDGHLDSHTAPKLCKFAPTNAKLMTMRGLKTRQCPLLWCVTSIECC